MWNKSEGHDLNMFMPNDNVQFYFEPEYYNKPVKMVYEGDSTLMEINDDDTITVTKKIKLADYE